MAQDQMMVLKNVWIKANFFWRPTFEIDATRVQNP